MMNDLNENKNLADEYSPEFSYNENKSSIQISFERIAFIFFIFFIIALVFSSKVILLSLEDKVFKKKILKKENFRSSIIDKKGNILAKTVPVINIGINPNLVIDKEKLLITLKLLFPKKNFKKKMYDKKFFYVQKTKLKIRSKKNPRGEKPGGN